MIDYPIPAKITLTLKNRRLTGEEFIGLSTDLYHRGLIYDAPRELRKEKNELSLIVTFTDVFAFKNWRANPLIQKHWSANFESFLTSAPQTSAQKDVIIEVDKIFNCNCKESQIKFYLLEGRRYGFAFIGGLTCGDCLGIIPMRRIPENLKLEEWLSLFEQVFDIWLQSGVLEKWALRELTNYKKGKLNLEGEKIRKELSEFFNKPVYISYFAEEPDIDKFCLICGDKGKKSGLKRPNKICNNCFTAFDYTK